MDPYQVLEINRNATDQQVKAAYNKLVKKYHPDAYSDNPLKELAEQKLREVNEAYEMIQKERTGGGGGGYNSGSYNSSYNSSSGSNTIYNDVRTYIERGNIGMAESLLQNKARNGEFYYLSAIIDFRRGNYNSGLNNLNEATRLDPSNTEYQDALRQVLNQSNNFNQYQGSPNAYQAGRSDQEAQCCQCLGAYCCLDALCNCC